MHRDVDCFLAETMSKIEEATYAIDAVAEICPEKPMMVSLTLGSDGNLRDGENVPAALSRLIDYASNCPIRLLAIMFNCAEPEAISKCLKTIHESSDLKALLDEQKIRLGAYANRLAPVDSDWTLAGSEEAQPMRDDLSAENYYSDFVSFWTRDYDVKIVGGCCGITPEHIQLLRNKLVSSIT